MHACGPPPFYFPGSAPGDGGEGEERGLRKGIERG